MKLKILTGCIMLMMVTATMGCQQDNQDTQGEDATDPVIDLQDEDGDDVVFAPYILTDYGDIYTDPYPLRDIDFTGSAKLHIEDQSSDGMDQLDLFIKNLKMAVYQKDADQLLSMISDDIVYTTNIGQGKVDFTNEYDLSMAPESSRLWDILEQVLIYGGILEYADIYHIPYMYGDLTVSNQYNAFVIGDGINLRSEPSVGGEIVSTMNFDKVLLLETTMETYDIEGKPYNWVKLRMMNGTEGYMVNKYIYSAENYHITIDHADGFWQIVSITKGE